MPKVQRAGMKVDSGFLFFDVEIARDNLDQMTYGFEISRLEYYQDRDMDLKVFIENLKSLVTRLEKELTVDSATPPPCA